MRETSGQNPTLENQQIEQGKAISDQNKMVGGNPAVSTKLPISQTQTRLQMTNPQAQGVNPVSASKKIEKASAAPTIPFHMLMPILRPHLDKDRDMQLQQIFSKLRSNEVSKEDFLRVIRNIVGDKMLRQAAHTVHLQMQAQATKSATSPNSNSSTSTSTGATLNFNPSSAPCKNPNQYSLPSQATSQQFCPGGFQDAQKVSLGQSPSPAQLQTESKLEPKGPQSMLNRPSMVSPSMQQLTRPPHQHGPSYPRLGNATPSLRTPTSQSQGMGPGQVGQQNWRNVGTTFGSVYMKHKQPETAAVGTLQQKQTMGAGPAPTRDESLGKLLPQRIGPRPGTGITGPEGQVSGTGHQMSRAESNMPVASSGPHHPLSGLTKAPSKKPYVGQKKPAEACISPPTSKKQKTGGAFLDQSIEQLNDVTAVSGVNLREEEEQLLSAPKEDSKILQAIRRVVQVEEDKLILQKCIIGWHIEEVFKAEMEVSLKEFEGLDSSVSLTSDIWTSSVNLGYLCLTAHYIDKSFNFKKKIISFKQIPYSHTGLAVASLIEKILMDWKLDGKIFTITRDNCSVNDNAIRCLQKKFWDKTVFEGEYMCMHIRCATHILNITLQDGMEIIQPSLHRIRELMRDIASSGSRLQMFNAILKDLNLPSKIGMTLDCPTRWNSTFEMVSEALKYKDALLRFGDSISMDVPSSEEWKELEEMMKFLEVILDVTKTFSAVRQPSSHSYMKEVYSIRSTLYEDDLSFNLQFLPKEMKIRFYKYWESPNLILTLACVFDPRRKLPFVDFCFQDAYGKETNKYYERLRVVQSSLRKFYNEYERTTYNTDRATSSGSPQVERGTLGKMKFEMRFSQFQFQNRHLRPNKSELDNYLEEPLVVSNEENFDVLQWWKRNSDLYPTLAKMSRDFLAVQVSTVASESAFSAVGRLTEHLRNSMNAETIEALVCSKDWFGSIVSSFNLEPISSINADTLIGVKG